MNYEGHVPVTIDKFQGLYQRGDDDNCPLDHFTDGDNYDFMGDDVVLPRPGIGISQEVAVPLENIKRLYNFPTATANTILALTVDGADGNIYHVVNSTTVFLILTITGMTDFAFVPYAGRAYITPFTSFVTGDLNIEKGLDNEFLYVYKGDGTTARKAAGATPAGVMTAANGAAGNTDAGLHIFAVVGETDTGYLSPPTGFVNFTTSANNSVSFSTIPVFTGAQWIKRHIVATLVIPTYDGNQQGYQFFFIPEATINDNITTVLNNISFFDEELIDDASHLLDNYSEIPAGAVLGMYRDRLCLATTFDDISIILVSAKGEPEAISQIDGLLIAFPDSNPITNLQEMRDVLYVFKRSKTIAYIDNGEEPSSWDGNIIDNAIGCPVHGIATVLDSGGTTIDYLIVTSYSGVIIFNGKYFMPELSWKIEKLWKDLDRNEFRTIQIINAPIQKWIVIVLPTGNLLIGNYANGMDYKKIRWAPASFLVPINSVAIWNIDTIILGSPIFVE